MDKNLLDTLIQVAVPAGIAFASGQFAFSILITKWLKGQMMNGDSRTLRKAVDDIGADLQEHRHETRAQLLAINGHLEVIDARTAAVETRLAKVEASAN